MGKLGKKARKFAKKHLQSVLRQRGKRRLCSRGKLPVKGGQNDIEEPVDNSVPLANGRSIESEGIENTSLGAVFTENDKDEVADASDSDGYLTEDSGCPDAGESETGKTLEDEIATSTYSAQNEKIHADLAIQKKKLDRLRKKDQICLGLEWPFIGVDILFGLSLCIARFEDPEFSKFLESFNNSAETFKNEDEISVFFKKEYFSFCYYLFQNNPQLKYSDEGDSSDQEQGDDDLNKGKGKFLTNSVINTWCQMAKEDHSQSALISLLNAYRAACHYGTESIGHRIENSETFCNILLLTLSNANDIFRGLLKMSSSNSTKETLQELKKAAKWKSLKPLVKSFVRSTLFLLNQVTDTDILTFAMTRLRACLIFFLAFPSLMQRFIKATVHLWATGERVLSLASYLVTRDIAAMFSSNYLDTCLSKALVAFVSRSRVTEIADIKHMQFLRDCIVELCSIDVQKSSLKAVASISQLAKLYSWGVQTKKKEAVRKICSWEYVNCVDLGVRFISANISDYDLQSLFFMTIQLINGLAYMFPGPRYFPLRLKCIGWLNHFARSSGNFIPLASLVLDILEYNIVKEGRKAQNAINIASVLKLPKQYLKSKSFQDECFHSAIEQLTLHFAQWSHHICFPDLATIPLIRLRKIHEITTIESLRRMVKRLIDQVELNVDFVQKKRDEVSFSPHDHQSVDSFLQLEKSSLNAPFTQYYRSVMEKAAERNLHKCGKISLPKQRNLKRNRTEPRKEPVAAEVDHPMFENGVMDAKRKKELPKFNDYSKCLASRN
ncbi:Nucleolar complex protein 2 [Sesamum angolense]|uniref:Nucleolar complex protein 2 n=1 Tax=Sesamum angolense TaxID=2727404 RepID=A0AAE1W377_9LAMI|nr:Nucleolar complex protein 2 [Sesamum angolense]